VSEGIEAATTVLCVDDDESILDLTEAYLDRESPFSLLTRQSGREAVELLDDGGQSVDAVVSDFQMPGMDGLELLEAVRERDEALPFILFTGQGSEAIASRAISAGVTDYLQKGGPEQYELLVNRIANAVSEYRAREDLARERRIRERILSATPVGIVGHDVRGDVIFRNERATEILSATDDQLHAAAYDEADWTLLTPAGEPVAFDDLPFRRVVESGERLAEAAYVVRLADGTETELRVFGAPLSDDDGAVTGAVIAFYPV
jgi:CheY-like chemotaxis protein